MTSACFEGLFDIRRVCLRFAIVFFLSFFSPHTFDSSCVHFYVGRTYENRMTRRLVGLCHHPSGYIFQYVDFIA